LSHIISVVWFAFHLTYLTSYPWFGSLFTSLISHHTYGSVRFSTSLISHHIRDSVHDFLYLGSGLMIMPREYWQPGEGPGITGRENDWKIVSGQHWSLDKNDLEGFSPQNTILDDETMYRIAISGMSGTDRNRFYSLNFSSKGYAQSRSKRIGKSVKTWNRHTKKWHYLIICENCQLHGVEEEHASLKRMYHAKRVVTASPYMSAVCVVQESTSTKISAVLTNQLAPEETEDPEELATTSFTPINKTIPKKDVHAKPSSSTSLLQRSSPASLLKEPLPESLPAPLLLVG
jgi:hypothetical protein